MSSQSANSGNNNNDNRDREQRNANDRAASGSHNRDNGLTSNSSTENLSTFNWGLLTTPLRTSLFTALRFLTSSDSPAEVQNEASVALDRFTARTATNESLRRAQATSRGATERQSQRTGAQVPQSRYSALFSQPPAAPPAQSATSNLNPPPVRRPLRREYAFYGEANLPQALRCNRRGGRDPIYNPVSASPWLQNRGTVTAARASFRRSEPANADAAPQPGPTNVPATGPSNAPAPASAPSDAPAVGSPADAPAADPSNAPAPGPSTAPPRYSNAPTPAVTPFFLPATAEPAPAEPAPAESGPAGNRPELYDFRAHATRLMDSPEGIAALIAAADHETIVRTLLASEEGVIALLDTLGAPRLAAVLMAREDGVRAVEAAAQQYWNDAMDQQERLGRVLHYVQPTARWRQDEDWEGGVVRVPPAREEGEAEGVEPAPEEPRSINEFMDDASMIESAFDDDECSQVADAAGSDTMALDTATPNAEASNAAGSVAGGSSTTAQPSQAVAPTAPDSPTRGTKRARDEEPQEEAEVRGFAPIRRIVRRRLSDGSAMRPSELATQSSRASSAPPMFDPEQSPRSGAGLGDAPETAIAIVDSDDETSSERTLQ